MDFFQFIFFYNLQKRLKIFVSFSYIYIIEICTKNRSSVTHLQKSRNAALTFSGFAIFLAGGTWVTIHGDVQCVAYQPFERASRTSEKDRRDQPRSAVADTFA